MELLIYLTKASLYGLLMWAIYCGAWKGRPWHTSSRIYLLISTVLPLILPLIHLPVSAPSAAGAYSISLPEGLVSTMSSKGSNAPVSPPRIVLSLYAFITIAVAGFYVTAYFRLLRKLRKGSSTRFAGYRIITHTGVGPGTIGTRIFFPGKAADNAILRHELAHIRAGHRFDSMLVQLLHIFFWISPALWLIGRELKTVHEFEADARVLEDTDATTYTTLLLSRTFGVNPINIAQLFFHHPLKRRILMLQQPKRSRIAKRSFFLSFLVTTMLCGSVLVAQTVEKSPAPKRAEVPKPETTTTKPQGYNPNQNFMPDGRRIYTSVNQLHHWPKKLKPGEKDNKEGC